MKHKNLVGAKFHMLNSQITTLSIIGHKATSSRGKKRSKSKRQSLQRNKIDKKYDKGGSKLSHNLGRRASYSSTVQ